MELGIAAKIVAIIGTAIVLACFIIIANVHATKHDPFFAGKKLNSRHIRANLAATATSLAGVLFFFMENTALFGWVLLLVPILNGLGFYVFLHIVDKVESSPEDTGSVARFLNKQFNRKYPGQISHAIILLNLIGIFMVEIVIGTTIFNYIFPGLGFQLIFALTIGVVSFYYIMKGGFFAVTQTDRWQYYLVLIGFTLAGISIFFLGATTQFTFERFTDIFIHPELGIGFQIAIVFNIIFTNLCIPSTQIGTWERYSSSSKQEAVQGFKNGIKFLLTPLWFLAISVSALVLLQTGGDMRGFDGLFDVLLSLGPVTSMIVFPLVFIGLVAALLSTVDSFMIASMLAIHDIVPGREARVEETRPLRRLMWITGASLVVAAVVLTWSVAQSDDIYRTVTQLLFATYGMPCLLLPLIWLAGRHSHAKEVDLTWAYVGIGFGLLALIAGSWHGMATGGFYGTILGPVIGIALAAAGSAMSNYSVRFDPEKKP